MKWISMAAGLITGGLLSGCAMAEPGPMRAYPAFGEAAPVRTVQYYQYYGYGDEEAYYGQRTYRYRERPSYGYGYYGAPRYGYGDYLEYRKDVIRDRREAQKDAIKEQRRVQKEIFKERQRAWNRAHGF